ncbi:hypothetical protein [Fulvivirga sp.]|uniref:hypothetical protein n=1 Tax=Fulvivirga sp. TaxID=1931237 RepID=UPI0032EEFB1F
MRSKFTIIQKVKAITALAVVFLLVLATNKMDSNHFAVVKETLSTVYEDRLVAQDYIYDLSKYVQEKRFALSAQSKVNTAVNDSINEILSLYAKTKLTKNEAQHFGTFKTHIDNLYKLEQNFKGEGNEEQKVEMVEIFGALSSQLDMLSEIQLDESKRQIDNSNRSIDTSDFIAKIEIGTLILIGIIIQILILYKPSN